jgi:hypothetical protein
VVSCCRLLQCQRQRRRARASVQCVEDTQPCARVGFDIGQVRISEERDRPFRERDRRIRERDR